MTKEEVMILIDKRIEDTKKKGALFPDNPSYYIGVKRGLLQAKELIGMIGSSNVLETESTNKQV